MSQHLVRLAALALVVLVLLVGVPGSEANFNRTTYLRGYKVKSTTDPSYECGGCARTRLVGCYNGVCTYRCYRSCTNGYDVIIEAHRFVLEGQKRRRRRFIASMT